MKILIIGGTGVIGSKILKILGNQEYDIKFTYLKNYYPSLDGKFLDITNKDSTISLIKNIKPEIIINASSFTNMDLCETNKKIAYKTNVTGLENIVSGAKIFGSKIIQISTSAVFSGERSSYNEEDQTSPISYYGLTKSIAEDIVKTSDLPYLILRTDQPYCWTEKWQHDNSVIRAIRILKKRMELNEIIDWYNSPTYVPNFVNVLKILMLEKANGVFHLVGPDYISRYNYSIEVSNVFNLNKNLIKPLFSKVLKLPAKRVNVRLCSEKLFQKTGIKMMSVKEGLTRMLEESKTLKNDQNVNKII